VSHEGQRLEATPRRARPGAAPARRRPRALGIRYDNALEAAGAQLKALGGNEGLANYFRFAFRG
jgi:hypothetical protein